MKRSSRMSKRRSVRRLSKRRSIRRMSKLSRMSKNLSRKLRKSGKRLLKKRSLKRGLIGAAALVGTALAVKKIRKDYNERYIYEEDKLVSADEESKVRFENLPISSSFDVRPKGYSHGGTKILTPDILYDTLKVELFKGDKKITSVVDKARLPGVSNNTKLPSYILINVILPALDTTNFTAVIFYKIKDSTIKAANSRSNSELMPAINLLENYVSSVTKDRKSKNYRDNAFRRFKVIVAVNKTGSLSIGTFGQGVIRAGGLKDQKGTIIEKTLIPKLKGKVLELGIDIPSFDVPTWASSFISIDSITGYYDKTQNMDVDLGFILEGGPDNKDQRPSKSQQEYDNELPEVLLGATKLLGLDMIKNTEPLFIGHPENSSKILTLLSTKDNEMNYSYTLHIDNILADIKNRNIDIEIEPADLLAIPFDDRCGRGKRVIHCPEKQNKKFFLFARYFYYTNLYNNAYELSSKYISYLPAPASFFGSHKYIAKGTCFANERIFNLYQCTNGSIQTYRFGFGIKNAFDEYSEDSPATDFTNILIDRIHEFSSGIRRAFGIHKKLICISLLTPCNTLACKAIKVGSKLLPKEAYFSFLENSIIDTENKRFNDMHDIFINVPLSSSKGFLFKSGTESLNPASDFQSRINISSPKETFESLVKIAILYYFNYSSTHLLCYHCKSGKDRTSMCDAIVQATIYYIETEKSIKDATDEPTVDMYEQIRKYTIYFLLYGYVITFYSTGIPGIKMGNLPVSKYVLGDSDYYQFFSGNSTMSRS